MRKNKVPVSAVVGVILGIVIATMTFVHTEVFEEIFYFICAIVRFLFADCFPDVDIDIAIRIWVAVFCLLGGIVAPISMFFIGFCADEKLYSKAKKICDLTVALCFSPYLIIILVSVISMLLGILVLTLDGFGGIPFILTVITAIALLLPKPKFKISNEAGCAFLAVALLLLVIFSLVLVKYVYGITAYEAYDAVFVGCICTCIVCGGNFLIMLVLERALRHDERIDKLPRILLILLGLLSCVYTLYAGINVAAYTIFQGVTSLRVSSLVLAILGFIMFCFLTRKVRRSVNNEAKI